jgi:hypothetical protein
MKILVDYGEWLQGKVNRTVGLMDSDQAGKLLPGQVP